jgi:nucleotide-binding universal stress UspA family protein
MADTADGIVAGYDGSPESERALDWAVWEARARDTALTICHVWAPGYDAANGAAAEAEPSMHWGQDVLDAGVRRATAGIGAGTVRPLLANGPPARVLCEQSEDAALVVVGSRGRGGLRGMLLGSVSLQVAAYASSTVTVVRGHWRPVPGRSRDPVVVGADGSDNSPAALKFALEEAERREVAAMAVCALADAAGSLGGSRQIQDDFEAALAKCVHEHPAVPVRRVISPGTPRAALLGAATDAQLLVVGARGRGGLREMRLGAVTLAMLHHAPCPVTVTRQP